MEPRGISIGAEAVSRWKDIRTWHFLKDPFAICTAIIGGVMLAILSNSFDPRDTFNLVWIVTTILLVMVVGSAERILVEAVFRMIGTVLGVGLGALIALGHNRMLKQGASVTALHAYQLGIAVAIVFLVSAFSKLYPSLSSILFFTGLTAAILIFSPDPAITYQRTLSVLLAVGAALTCTILFHYTVADELLFRDHRVVADKVLQLTEFAVSSQLSEKADFDQAAALIRTSLSSASVVWEAYDKWRRLTLRKPAFDFASVTHALRPLYYETFSLFWSHIETSLRPGDARILYCDTEEDYEVLFRPMVHCILQGIHEVRAILVEVLDSSAIAPDRRRAKLRRLTEIIGANFVINLQIMNMRYVDNRLLCYSHRSQRWRMCDYLLSLACVLMELTEYLKCVVMLFEKEDLQHYQDILPRFTLLKDQLNTFKYSSRVLMDITPVLTHPVSIEENMVSNPDHRRSERRIS